MVCKLIFTNIDEKGDKTTDRSQTMEENLGAGFGLLTWESVQRRKEMYARGGRKARPWWKYRGIW